MQSNRGRLIKTTLIAMLALAEGNLQAQSQTTYPKPITGTTITITSGGLKRTFIVHIPPTPKSSPGAVLIFHGGSGNPAAASQMQALTLMDNVADREGFYSVYPQALNGHWTDGRVSTQGGADDVQFTRDIATYLEKTYKVSSAKIFSAGLSNGGIMQYELACTAPGLIRAIAPVAADMTLAMQSACHPTKTTPLIMFSGTADQYMPYGGGYPVVYSTNKTATTSAKFISTAQATATTQTTSTTQTDEFASAPATAASFASMNGCKSSTATNLADKVADGTTVSETVYKSCTTGGGTDLYTILNGGHTWPGAKGGDPSMGLNTQDISANEEMVTFFKQFGL
jgi:polyhydroxybutyrate depolymerase